ncbi:MAG: hypothetical protein NT103_05185 [Campylobacterales bacterium]|nr:hypothetical protein [Campylobacterales bacterium]
MTQEAILSQLGLIPNVALADQLERIEKNTHGFEKIIKHVMDLHEALKTNEAYVALSNTVDLFKIKIDATSKISATEAMEKINHFADKFKVKLQKVEGKETFYIVGFAS